MRILVVDDSRDIRDLLRCSLGDLGRCDLAENGLIAVEMVRQASSEHDPYALITMDCQMPVLDGFSAISMIRTFEAAQKEPLFRSTICIISADNNCLQKYEEKHGSDDFLHYLQKPFLLVDLYEIAQTAQRRLQDSLPYRRFLPESSMGMKPAQTGRQAACSSVC